MKNSPGLPVLCALLFALPVCAAEIPQADYVWKSVILGGGGSVPGLVIHPRVPDLVYIRTDVGGAYRWDAAREEWIPLQDFLPPDRWNLYGADSLAIDPSDASGQTLLLSTGKYDAAWTKAPGVVMRSTDRGASWTETTFQAGGSSNTEQRFGDRLSIDPLDGSHALAATRARGLWRSADGGLTWSDVAGAPRGLLPKEGNAESKGLSGLVFAVFDPASGRTGTGRTRTIYLGSSGEGVYRSTDGGETWALLPGSPVRPIRSALGPDGSLLVSHEAGLARFADDVWTDITPPAEAGKPLQAVSVDPRDARHLLVAPSQAKHELPLYRSTDAGKTWSVVKGRRDQTVPWWPSWHWFSSIGSVTFDPHHPNRVWVTDWYGVYRTPDITAPEVTWTNYTRGHEEVVTVGAMITLPQGDIPLFSGVADVGGFDHESLDEIPRENIWAKGFPGGFTCTGLAFQPSNPLFMARVGARDWRDPGTGGYSLDGGRTWTMFPTLPYKGIRGGRVAIAASGPRILWAPQQGEPYFTDDYGATWTKCESGEELKYTVRGMDVFQFHQPLAADGADPNRFYIFKKGKLWRSDDGGASWKIVASTEDEGTHTLASVPGRANEVWLGMNYHGLRRSRDGGATWARLDNVTRAAMFAFGKNPSGGDFPSIYLQGAVNKQDGYFRSDDEGRTWVRIDLPTQKIGNAPNTMAGDWQVPGRVFVGTNGRGILYGEPAR